MITVYWFVNEVTLLENNVNFFLENMGKVLKCCRKMVNLIEIPKSADFVKKIDFNKIRDHYRLTSRYRIPAHEKFNKNVKQKRSKFFPLAFHIFSIYDCHLFLKKLVDKKKDSIDLEVIPKKNGEFFPVSYGCIRLIE